MSPTGRQYTLSHGDQRAVVVELGAALRSYEVGGRAVLDGFAVDEPITGGRGQVLLPWPNRIRDGRYSWEGEDLQLPLAEPAAGNAIHGLMRWVAWQLAEQSEDQLTLTGTVWPQPGYPFHLAVGATYRLGEDGLSVEIRAHNVGATTAPYGVGQHPYLTVGGGLVDRATLTLPASSWLRVDDRGTPVATELVAASGYDFRAGRAIGEQRIDTAFTGLTREGDGRARVRLSKGEDHVELWLGEGAEVVQVYTGDKLPVDRRRRGVAIEPMSCPPDAFRSGSGVVTLKPDEEHVFAWGLTAG